MTDRLSDTDLAAIKQRDSALDVQRIVTVKVQRATDRTGRDVYRHVLATEWTVVPNG